MAIGRLTPAPLHPQTARPQAPEAARSAQRAFFAAAAGGAQPDPAPVATAPVAQKAPPAIDPERPLRPGSLLDIKV